MGYKGRRKGKGGEILKMNPLDEHTRPERRNIRDLKIYEVNFSDDVL